MYYKFTKFYENSFTFFLCEEPLILRVGRKLKTGWRYLQDDLRSNLVGLGATLGDGEKFNNKYVCSFRDFSGKSR